MGATTVLGERGAVPLDAEIDGDRVWVLPEDLEAAIGWTLKPEGLCQDDVCVPVRDRDTIEDGGRVDLAAVAGVLGSPTLLAAEEAVLAVGIASGRRQAGLVGREAPDFELPDLDGVPHRLSEWAGRRRLLVAFATW